MNRIAKLIPQAIATVIFGGLLLALLILLPAGTFNFLQAWVFIAVFLVTVTIFGLYYSIKDPALMERRKQVGPKAEQSTLQKIIGLVALTSLVAVFVICGLDHRFGWSHMPPVVSWIGDGVEVLSFIMFSVVFNANSYGGSNINVEEKQTVSSTGPYAIVRHPLYVGTFVMVIGIALGLGSWWALLIILLQIPVLVIRILDEEKLMEIELEGYEEYEQKVKYRLAPYLW